MPDLAAGSGVPLSPGDPAEIRETADREAELSEAAPEDAAGGAAVPVGIRKLLRAARNNKRLTRLIGRFRKYRHRQYRL